MTFHLHTRDGTSFLASDLLARVPDVQHAFSTRLVGVGGGPSGAANPEGPIAGEPGDLGLPANQDRPGVERNWERFLSAVGADWTGVWHARQVHGRQVFEAPVASGPGCLGQGDGLWTARAGTGLAIQTADCVALLVAAADGRAVAAVHAGWRGVLGGVVESAVALLGLRCGVRPQDLIAVAGPHIRDCCFEVQEDVAAPFRERFGDSVVAGSPSGRRTVSLEAALRRLLDQVGLPPNAIDVCPFCTCCRPDLFFSYRRDRGRVPGRLAGVIGRRKEGSP